MVLLRRGPELLYSPANQQGSGRISLNLAIAMPMRNTLIAALLLLVAPLLPAAEELIVVGDGVELKSLFFQPEDNGNPPRLAVFVTEGSNNEFMARGQFWIGRELVRRGWAVAMPISPGGRGYFVENHELIPDLISRLYEVHELSGTRPLLVGVSSGGSAALILAARHPEKYLGVVATPGRIKEEDESEGFTDLAGMQVYLRVGEKDNFHWNRGLDHTVEVLTLGGARVDAAIVPDAKHIFRPDWENLEAWLKNLK